METKSIKVYTIDELSPIAQSKVVQQWVEENDSWVNREITDHLLEFLRDKGVEPFKNRVVWSLYSQGSGARFEFYYTFKELFLDSTPIILVGDSVKEKIKEVEGDLDYISYSATDIINRYAFHDVNDVGVCLDWPLLECKESCEFIEVELLQIVRNWYDGLCKALYHEAKQCYEGFTSSEFIIEELRETERLLTIHGTEVTHLVDEK
jgi:hypothetical protein